MPNRSKKTCQSRSNKPTTLHEVAHGAAYEASYNGGESHTKGGGSNTRNGRHRGRSKFDTGGNNSDGNRGGNRSHGEFSISNDKQSRNEVDEKKKTEHKQQEAINPHR